MSDDEYHEMADEIDAIADDVHRYLTPEELRIRYLTVMMLIETENLLRTAAEEE